MLKTIAKKISIRLNRRVEKEHSGQIIALGGGGFSDEPDNPLLDEYILAQTNKAKPSILFLPTAGGDHQDYISKFYRAYEKLYCTPSHLSLTKIKMPYLKLEELVLSQDAVFVGGGSPRFLMQVWRKCGMDRIMRKAWKKGIVLSGMSAGAICWYEDGFKNPKDDLWRRVSCLGFLEGSFCPHYDKRGELRAAYRKMISSQEITGGFGVQDGVALHYTGTELKHIVTSVQGAKAFHVKKSGPRVTEREVKSRYLGIFEDVKVIDAEAAGNKTAQHTAIVKEYVKRINNHDLDGMIEMMSDDHCFIDSMGINMNGKENMRSAWDTFLTFFPDYRVSVNEFIPKNGIVAMFGKATGTLAADGKISEENKFEIPASWTAVVKDNKIAEWRVYGDSEPVRKLIQKYRNI